MQESARFVFDKNVNYHQLTVCLNEGKQAVLVLHCDNLHMGEDMMVEPGLVMIFAHGVE